MARDIDKPEYIKPLEAVSNFVCGLGLIAFAMYAHFTGEIILQGHGTASDLIFSDESLKFLVASLILGSLCMFIKVIDYYDKRNNEIKYKLVGRWVKGSSALLMLYAFILEFPRLSLLSS